MKGQEVEIKKEIEELNFKPTNVSIDDMDKLEQKEVMKKRLLAKSTCYSCQDWFINYIPDPVKNGEWCYRQNCETF